MRSYSILLLTILSLYSCKKGNIQIPTEPPQQSACDWNKIAWWGDSHSLGSGAIRPSWFMANYLGVDSLYLYGRWRMKYSDADSLPAASITDPNRTVYTFAYPGQTSPYIRKQFDAVDQSIKDLPTVLWTGNNNWFDTLQIRQDIESMLSELHHTNFIVIGLLTGDWPDQWIGTVHYQVVEEFNNRMARRLPRHFMYPKDFLPYSGSPKDQIDKAHGVSPTSLRIDELHLNFYGEQDIGEAAAKMLKPCQSQAN